MKPREDITNYLKYLGGTIPIWESELGVRDFNILVRDMGFACRTYDFEMPLFILRETLASVRSKLSWGANGRPMLVISLKNRPAHQVLHELMESILDANSLAGVNRLIAKRALMRTISTLSFFNGFCRRFLGGCLSNGCFISFAS
ncbi:MAG: hypothetical protein HKL80_06910 [Acidimicrobiales bacterium]|nr:hypothetical protein [Acidimicrobiales bacterium]